MNRREFVAAAAAGAVGIMTRSVLAQQSDLRPVKVVAFDAFAILDPRPIAAAVEKAFPTHGDELSSTWRTRQFAYTWLRTSARQYTDFWTVTADALADAARSLGLNLAPSTRDQLMNEYLHLKAYADVADGLVRLKNAGLRLAFLSNFTTRMMEAGVRNSKLDGLFTELLSTDRVKAFKPAPEAYQMALDAFAVNKRDVLFVPFAAWDAAGAKWFGYPTFWLNRQNQPAEALGAPTADGTGRDLSDLVRFAVE